MKRITIALIIFLLMPFVIFAGQLDGQHKNEWEGKNTGNGKHKGWDQYDSGNHYGWGDYTVEVVEEVTIEDPVIEDPVIEEPVVTNEPIVVVTVVTNEPIVIEDPVIEEPEDPIVPEEPYVTWQTEVALARINIIAPTQLVDVLTGTLVEYPEGMEGIIYNNLPRYDVMEYGVVKFEVIESGLLMIAVHFGYQGNVYGGWYEERMTLADFQNTGWTDTGLTLVTREHQSRTYMIFEKVVETGQTYTLRCNKYEPPYPIELFYQEVYNDGGIVFTY